MRCLAELSNLNESRDTSSAKMASALHYGNPKPPRASLQRAPAASRPAPPRSGEGSHCQHHALYTPLRVKCCMTLHAALGPRRLAHPRVQHVPTCRATRATDPYTTSTTPMFSQLLMRATYLYIPRRQTARKRKPNLRGSD